MRNSPRRKESFGTIRFSVRPVVGPQIAINLLSNTYILGLLKASAVRTTSHYLRYSVFCLAQYVLNAHGSCTLLLQLYIRVHSHSGCKRGCQGCQQCFDCENGTAPSQEARIEKWTARGEKFALVFVFPSCCLYSGHVELVKLSCGGAG